MFFVMFALTMICLMMSVICLNKSFKLGSDKLKLIAVIFSLFAFVNWGIALSFYLNR